MNFRMFAKFSLFADEIWGKMYLGFLKQKSPHGISMADSAGITPVYFFVHSPAEC